MILSGAGSGWGGGGGGGVGGIMTQITGVYSLFPTFCNTVQTCCPGMFVFVTCLLHFGDGF